MHQLNLTSDEAQVLQDALQCFLADLRVEVSHTDNWEYRSALKRNEARLRKVLSELTEGTPAVG
jgi:hypothetical protein